MPTEVSIRRNTVVGSAEVLMEEQKVFLEQERQEVDAGNLSIRRIQIKGKGVESKQDRNHSTQKGIPAHLQQLLSSATKGKANDRSC